MAGELRASTWTSAHAGNIGCIDGGQDGVRFAEAAGDTNPVSDLLAIVTDDDPAA